MRRSRIRRPMEEPSNRDRWMVSYADFITVLFAFFVVLFASSNRDGQTIKKLSQAIHTGFQQLGPFAGRQSEQGNSPGLPRNTPAAAPPAPPIATVTNDATAAWGIDIDALKRQLEAAIGPEIRNHEVTMRVTPEGFVISLKELGFFHSGEAVLRPGAAEKIERIAKVLAQHGFDLRVEGHSDNQPIHTAQFRSNWQLSTARATAVLLLLVNDSGLAPEKISLAGYGQYRPIADNLTAEGRKMNRRVDLVVIPAALPQQTAVQSNTKALPDALDQQLDR
jgi:chemotaxis protein MotB